jgi:hypothetical protein
LSYEKQQEAGGQAELPAQHARQQPRGHVVRHGLHGVVRHHNTAAARRRKVAPRPQVHVKEHVVAYVRVAAVAAVKAVCRIVLCLRDEAVGGQVRGRPAALARVMPVGKGGAERGDKRGVAAKVLFAAAGPGVREDAQQRRKARVNAHGARLERHRCRHGAHQVLVPAGAQARARREDGAAARARVHCLGRD